MKTHTGGCHCGNVRYEVDIALENAMECNCSHCSKKGFLLAFAPKENFRTETDESTLGEYRFNKKAIAHLFCPTCGIQSYGRGKNAKGEETVAINVRCLDGVDIDSLTINKVDGKSY
jgi:hypothetical protein